MVAESTRPTSQKIGVLLCGCEGKIAEKVNLPQVRDWLKEKHPTLIMKTSNAICKMPNEIGTFIKLNKATNIIVGACSKYRELFEEVAAKANLGAFCLKTVSLLERCALIHSPDDATQKARIMLLAAVLRERKFEGVRTENLRFAAARLDRKMDRRSFLTFPIKLRHQIVPTIDADNCVAWCGCKLCIEACPKQAFLKKDKRIHINTSKCEGCGVCMVACPKRAIFFPTQSPLQIDEEIRTLVSTDDNALKPRIILFACLDGKSRIDKLGTAELSYPANLMVVEVSCIGVITPFFILRVFELGAEAVGLVPCQTRCHYRHDLGLIYENVQASKELLRVFGLDPRRISVIGQSPGDLNDFHSQLKIFAEKVPTLGLSPLYAKEPSELALSWSNLSYMVKHIRDELGIDRTIRVCSQSLPFCMITVETDKCSMCGSCVGHCPPEAISLKDVEGHLALLHDYSLCMACGMCVHHCPESAMQIEKVLDMRKLDAPLSTLVEDEMAVCQMCKSRFFPKKQIRAVSNRLLVKSDNYTPKILSYCPDCRIKAWLKDMKSTSD